MTTLSVPIADEDLRRIEELVALGLASNKADLMRRALQKYLADLAVEAVLKARQEPTLSGDLDDLASKL